MTGESGEIHIVTGGIETPKDRATSTEIGIGIMITIVIKTDIMIAIEIVIAMMDTERKMMDIVGKTTEDHVRTPMATEKDFHVATTRTKEPQKSTQKAGTAAMRSAQIQMASQTHNP